MMSWQQNRDRKVLLKSKQKYFKARIQGHSQREAANMANLPRTPDKLAAMDRSISDLLWEAGATNHKLARRISEGLDSNKVTRTQDGSEYIDADMKERREYIKLTAELTGLLKKESTNVAIQINLPGSLASSFADEMVTIESIIDQDGTNV